MERSSQPEIKLLPVQKLGLPHQFWLTSFLRLDNSKDFWKNLHWAERNNLRIKGNTLIQCLFTQNQVGLFPWGNTRKCNTIYSNKYNFVIPIYLKAEFFLWKKLGKLMKSQKLYGLIPAIQVSNSFFDC